MSNNKVLEIIELIKKGPRFIEEIEIALDELNGKERRELVNLVTALNLEAPQSIFYDYETQTWLI